MVEKDVWVVNIFDVDIVVVYSIDDVILVVIWNLFLGEIVGMLNSIKVFDFFEIFGEIIDLLVVNSKILKVNLNFGKVLIGVWYEIMSSMSVDDKFGIVVRMFMGKVLGIDLVGYEV